MKFRKKPVVIEAIQFNGSNQDELVKFAGNHIRVVPMSMCIEGKKMRVATLEGWIYASENDWIIKGVNGEFYPCKPDIFVKTYEEV